MGDDEVVAVEQTQRSGLPTELAYRRAEHHVDDVFQRQRPGQLRCDALQRVETGGRRLGLEPGGPFGLEQPGPFRLAHPSLRDIGAHPHHPDRRARLVVHHGSPRLDPPQRPVWATDPVGHLRAGAVLGRPPDRGEHGRQILREDVALKRLERPRECPGLEPMEPFQRGRPDDVPGRHVPFPGAHRPGLEREGEVLAAAAKFHLVALAVDRPGDELRNRGCDADLLLGEGVRSVVIEHELPEQAAGVDQGNERERHDAFGVEHRTKCSHLRIERNIRHQNRFRILRVGRPGTVPVHRRPVCLRKPPPAAEPHDALAVEQQDRRSLDADGPLERDERSLVDPLDGLRFGGDLAEIVDREDCTGPSQLTLAGTRELIRRHRSTMLA
jgi:hypothetical protein